MVETKSLEALLSIKKQVKPKITAIDEEKVKAGLEGALRNI